MLAATPFDRPGLGRANSDKSKSLTLPPISELYRIADRYPVVRPLHLSSSPNGERHAQVPAPLQLGQPSSATRAGQPASPTRSPRDELHPLPSPPPTPLSARSSLSSTSATSPAFGTYELPSQQYTRDYRNAAHGYGRPTASTSFESQAPLLPPWSEPAYSRAAGWSMIPHSPAVSESYLNFAHGPPGPAWSSVPVLNSRKRSSSEADVLKGGIFAFGDPSNPKYKKRSRNHTRSSCHCCGCSDAPEWRRGPNGPRTLCSESDSMLGENLDGG